MVMAVRLGEREVESYVKSRRRFRAEGRAYTKALRQVCLFLELGKVQYGCDTPWPGLPPCGSWSRPPWALSSWLQHNTCLAEAAGYCHPRKVLHVCTQPLALTQTNKPRCNHPTSNTGDFALLSWIQNVTLFFLAWKDLHFIPLSNFLTQSQNIVLNWTPCWQ